jgi:Amino acid transporters
MPNKPKQKALGFWMLTALVTGNMIGSGVFLLPAALASYGSIGIVAWLVTSLGALCLALVFGKLSTVIRKTGGPYAYCREGFGNFIGFLVAYNYWIALCIGNAAIVVAFTGYLTLFFPVLHASPWFSCLTSIATVWLLTLVNLLGIRRAGVLQLVTTLLKLTPLLLIAIFGLFYIDVAHLKQFNVSGQPNFIAFTGAATLTLWSFIGLESATVPAENVENARHTILWATIIGTLMAAFVYILSTTAIMGIVPIQQLARSTAPYADAATIIFGSWGGKMIALGALISCFGTLNGWTLLQGQIPFAAAKDHLFPAIFARESRFGTPAFALCISSGFISLLLLLTLNDSLVKQFTFIILLATLASLIPYFLTVMSELILLIKRPHEFNFKYPRLSLAISIIAGLYAFWMILGAGETVVYYGTLLFLSAMPVYVGMHWRNASESANQTVGDTQPLPNTAHPVVQ